MQFFKSYKTVIFIVVLLAVTLAILSFHLKTESRAGLMKKVVLELSAPLQNALYYYSKSVGDAWFRYVALVGLEQENKKLHKQIDDLKAQVNLYKESYLEAQRLHKLLALKENHDFNFVAARIIGRGQVAFSRTVLINKGTTHGLKVGMPVMAGHGLVGRITSVSWRASKVLLLIDESSNIDAIVQRNRTQGIIRGAGSQGYALKYVSKTQDVKEGDIIISSGIGGVFPKGQMIGQVSHVDKQDAGLFYNIQVAPFVDFSKLEEVKVLASDNDNKDEGG